jgi:hypothetical protein
MVLDKSGRYLKKMSVQLNISPQHMEMRVAAVLSLHSQQTLTFYTTPAVICSPFI